MNIMFQGQPLSLTQVGVWFVVAIISGVLAESLIGYSHFGLLQAAAVGLVGAFIGTWLSSTFNLPAVLTIQIANVTVELFWCTLGAILLLLLIQSLRVRRAGGGRVRERRQRRRGY